MKIKKSTLLGQHFLTSRAYAGRIVDAGNVTAGDVILEIGPGKGMLTQELLARGARVTAVEKDPDMLAILQERFRAEITANTLRIVIGDIREIDLKTLGFKKQNYKLIANIPYYITGELLRMFLASSSDTQPSCIVFLVQKEVAQRIVAHNGKDKGKESLLSLSVKAFGTPTLVATVKAGNFSPPPKVDSAILAITDISRKHFATHLDEEHFFALIHAGFAHKRKVLKKNLEAIATQEAIKTAFTICNLQEKARAEELSLDNWLALLNMLYHRRTGNK